MFGTTARPVTYLQHLREQLEKVYDELEEIEIRVVIRTGLHAWARFTHFQLMKVFFGYRYMRGYLMVSRGCVHLARWQQYVTHEHRRALVEEATDLRWRIYELEEQQLEELELANFDLRWEEDAPRDGPGAENVRVPNDDDDLA